MTVSEFMQVSENNSELAGKIKNCESIEEFVSLASDEGHSFSADEVKAEFMADDGELSDDDLDNLAGGTGSALKPGFTRRG